MGRFVGSGEGGKKFHPADSQDLISFVP